MAYTHHLSPELIQEFEQAVGLSLQKMRGLNKQKKIQEETELVLVPASEETNDWRFSLVSNGEWLVHHDPNIIDTFTQLDAIIMNYAILTGEIPPVEVIPEEFFIEQGNHILYALIELLREKARELR
jgi:hypothetical protein